MSNKIMDKKVRIIFFILLSVFVWIIGLSERSLFLII